jgi:predicted metalloprotease with PDZ domain
MAGYRLVFKEQPNPFAKQDGAAGNFVWSLGFDVGKDGAVGASLWDSPGFKAGLVPGTTIVAVDGWAFSQTRLSDAVKAAKGKDTPIRLIVKRGERIETVDLRYDGGLRHPWLEPVGKGTQPLDRLLAPRTR